MLKMRFQPDDPGVGAQDAPPGPLIGWGGGYPPARFDPGTFGARQSATPTVFLLIKH